MSKKDISTTHHAPNMMSKFARITTRHSYDLSTGKALHSQIRYRLYPKYYFKGMINTPELFIMVHGLRNDERGASEKLKIAQNMLQRLWHGDDSYHAVGFSYDSNTRGAHISRYQKHALAVGRRIAKANRKYLAQFLLDFKKNSKNTKIRLLGHSLGSEVIHHTIVHLASLSKLHSTHNIIESAHFFGSSLPNNIQHDAKVCNAIDHCISDKLVNYYAPTDDVLSYATKTKIISGARPLGLCGVASGPVAAKYRQYKVCPENHRFASYATALESFP